MGLKYRDKNKKEAQVRQCVKISNKTGANFDPRLLNPDFYFETADMQKKKQKRKLSPSGTLLNNPGGRCQTAQRLAPPPTLLPPPT